ncbi:MAG: hypothetical protein JSU07_00385 [Bacteroidetes bacterium]|nr:hypothetical protein [Bacteroidota bacterium]
MGVEIKTIEVPDEDYSEESGETITHYLIDKDDGAIVININKILEESISECSWYGNDKKFIGVDYYDWDSNELTAIMNTNGDVLRSGITYVEEYLEKQQLFIINISGYGLKYQSLDYDIEEDENKFAVMDREGCFIIPPKYNAISFDKTAGVFYADRFGENSVTYSIKGKIINEED